MADTNCANSVVRLREAERERTDPEHQRVVEQWLTTVRTGPRFVYSADKSSLSVVIPLPLKLCSRPSQEGWHTLYSIVSDTYGYGWGPELFASRVKLCRKESDGRSRYTVADDEWEHQAHLVAYEVLNELNEATAGSAEQFKWTHAIIDPSKVWSDEGKWTLDRLHPGELCFECIPECVDTVKAAMDKMKMDAKNLGT